MSGAGDPVAVPVPTLVGFLLILVAQRVGELVVSASNARWLLAHGAREEGRGHYPLLVLLHALFPPALLAEVLVFDARPGTLSAWWLALWLAAQGLRYAAIRALGQRWNTRVLVLAGAPRVRHGPYRWLRHPNYLAVVIEFIAAPLMFGAWRTALAFSLANLLALTVRIRCEERALAGADVEPPSTVC